MLFKADLITYYGVYRTIETDKLNVPTPEGRRTILSNHMPIMLPLEIGIVETSNSGKLSHYAINGGVLYFRDNKAELVLNNVIDVEEIDVDNVKAEVDRINRELKNVRSESRRIRLGYELEVAENRLKAAEKYL